MSNNKRLAAVVGVSAIALVSEFIFKQPLIAQGIITVMGSLIALAMFLEMVKTLMAGNFGVDLLAITAVVATLLVGQYWAAMVVLLMLTGGDTLEDHAAHVADSDLANLLNNAPTEAHRLVDGRLVTVPSDDVTIGELIVVRPGEIVPVDGIITDGESLVDEASLTGESKPIAKKRGDELMSGAVNGDAALTMRVERAAKDSQYQAIVKLVQASKERPAHFVRMADRYALPFTILAYIIAGTAWFISKDPVRAAEVLVVASPCPLILAAPVALVSGMSRTSRNGIIIKTGTAIEKLASVKTVAFDKTGTLTRGILAVDQLQPVEGMSQERLLLLAASAEQQSGHILARSLVRAVGSDALLEATAGEETTGSGVAAEVEGQTVRVGSPEYANASTEVDQTAVYVSVDGKYAGLISFHDVPRPEAASTLRWLKDLGVEDTMMITGDSNAIAAEIADTVGIDTIHAEQLPQGKIDVIDQLPKSAHPVAMVGDGVNDAPVLATADIGIAIAAHGANAASESADAVVVQDDLSKVAQAVLIAQDTMVVARQAVWIGIGICTILMFIAATGIIPTIIGALFQEVVDTVTIVYALRARKGIRSCEPRELGQAM